MQFEDSFRDLKFEFVNLLKEDKRNRETATHKSLWSSKRHYELKMKKPRN
jgi:hypothetical protein